jgi:hypothetical protein
MKCADAAKKAGQATFPHSVLRDACPTEVDPQHKERYLERHEFELLFDLTPEEFALLPADKQTQRKGQLGLV